MCIGTMSHRALWLALPESEDAHRSRYMFIDAISSWDVIWIR